MTSIDAWTASDPDERQRWLSVLQDWTGSPPAAFPSYLELFAPDGEVVLMHRRDGARTTVMPLVLRRIPGEADAWDAVGPYGYGAAFSNQGDPDPAFWEAVGEWALGRGLVSIVVRLPVTSDTHVDWPFDRHDVGLNVVRDVVAWDDFWDDVDRKVRKNYRRATTAGLTVERVRPEDGIDDFLTLYLGTMERRDAVGSFHLDETRLSQLVDDLGPRADLFFTVEVGRRISTELVLREGSTAYSFLGRTDDSRFEMRPNDLLKCEIVRWAVDEGLARYVLGGGVGGSGDGIFRYKRAFAPTGVVPFAIGEWVVDRSAYERLAARANGTKASGWPRYR